MSPRSGRRPGCARLPRRGRCRRRARAARSRGASTSRRAERCQPATASTWRLRDQRLDLLRHLHRVPGAVHHGQPQLTPEHARPGVELLRRQLGAQLGGRPEDACRAVQRDDEGHVQGLVVATEPTRHAVRDPSRRSDHVDLPGTDGHAAGGTLAIRCPQYSRRRERAMVPTDVGPDPSRPPQSRGAGGHPSARGPARRRGVHHRRVASAVAAGPHRRPADDGDRPGHVVAAPDAHQAGRPHGRRRPGVPPGRRGRPSARARAAGAPRAASPTTASLPWWPRS